MAAGRAGCRGDPVCQGRFNSLWACLFTVGELSAAVVRVLEAATGPKVLRTPSPYTWPVLREVAGARCLPAR